MSLFSKHFHQPAKDHYELRNLMVLTPNASQLDHSANPNRLAYIDALRVVACFAVVAVHVLQVALHHGEVGSAGWWFSNLVMAVFYSSVPLFVMISGALLIDINKNDSFETFFKKRMNRLLIPIIFWSLFYLGYTYIESGLTSKMAIWLILHGVPYNHMWYLYMTLGLYIFLIPIRSMCINSNRKTLLITIIIMFSVLAIYYFDESRIAAKGVFKEAPLFVLSFIPFLPYFVCGYYLKNTNIMISRRYYIYPVLIITCIMSIINWEILKDIGQMSAAHIIYNNLNPMVGIISILLFLFVKTSGRSKRPYFSDIDRIWTFVGPLTLGIYIIHPVFVGLLTRVPSIRVLFFDPLSMIALTIGIYIISMLATYIMTKIPYVRRTVL